MGVVWDPGGMAQATAGPKPSIYGVAMFTVPRVVRPWGLGEN